MNTFKICVYPGNLKLWKWDEIRRSAKANNWTIRHTHHYYRLFRSDTTKSGTQN